MVAAAAENGYTSEARGITADARSWGTARTKAREYADLENRRADCAIELHA
jgi:hypothetical protein